MQDFEAFFQMATEYGPHGYQARIAREGLPDLAYSKPRGWPTASCWKVEERYTGVLIAPVTASGDSPPCTALVSNPSPSTSG